MTKRERLIDYIERLNDGDDMTEEITLFHSFDNLIKVINKEGLLMTLNPHSANFNEDYQGQVLLAMLDNDTTGNVFKLIVNESFNDILMENGNYYYKGSYNNNDLTELKELFDSSSESIADAILSNEYYEMFSIDSFDAFVDVVDNLNIANQERLKQYILENHRGFEFDDGTILSDDNVIDAINDQGATMKFSKHLMGGCFNGAACFSLFT